MNISKLVLKNLVKTCRDLTKVYDLYYHSVNVGFAEMAPSLLRKEENFKRNKGGSVSIAKVFSLFLFAFIIVRPVTYSPENIYSIKIIHFHF